MFQCVIFEPMTAKDERGLAVLVGIADSWLAQAGRDTPAVVQDFLDDIPQLIGYRDWAMGRFSEGDPPPLCFAQLEELRLRLVIAEAQADEPHDPADLATVWYAAREQWLRRLLGEVDRLAKAEAYLP